MAAHVVVIDSTARRAMIKTTPGTFLSDVLQEASGKLGFKPSQYGLKHNNKQVDLSRTIRLSGLSSGAKLELVQLSKSAGVVSVALQVPESDAPGVPTVRLTDKFPSTTTLWLILRKFEAGVAGGGGGGVKRNLTARGAPAADSGNAGAGRLYYQQPVLNIMGRELLSFTDLQKSLAQLGFNSGSTLIRLSFRTSDRPLEEAMAQIQDYFDSVDGPTTAATPALEPAPKPVEKEWLQDEGITTTTPIGSGPVATSPPEAASQPEDTVMTGTLQLESQAAEVKSHEATAASLAASPQTLEESQVMAGDRPVSVYRPPSSATVSTAITRHNEADFTPTVEHAQVHQKMLQQASQNRRLPTDAELEAQAKERMEQLSIIKDIEIKIRFPDQSAISSKFTQADTAADLHSFVRSCLDEQYSNEMFVLRNPGVHGKDEMIPQDPKKRLIRDLQLKGRILVVFGWDDNKASVQAKSAKSVLKQDLRAQAQEYKVPDIPGMATGADQDDPGVKVDLSKKDNKDSGGDGKKKVPKWLKGLGGKK